MTSFLIIVKPGIPDWQGNYGKMISNSNFKLKFSKRSWDIVSGFLLEFGVILQVWPPGVLNKFKFSHSKTRNVELASQR